MIPASLSGIVESVDGLSSLQTMFPASPGYKEPASPVYSAGPAVSMGAHGGANGSHVKLRAAMRASRNRPNITGGAYDPTDIYNSQGYDYNALYSQSHCCNPLGNPNVTPAATSIAIATFGRQAASDIAGFHNQYSYLAYHFQEIYIDGTPACCDAEGTMDMEWSTAMSNSFGSFVDTAMVYLYDGANFNNSTFTDMYNRMVSDNSARVFSTSWSCTETYGCSSSTISTRDAIFAQMVGQGWTLVAASGDRGAFDDCSHLSVAYPASDPNVVGAGGTELSLSSGPVFNSETAWAGGPDGCNSNDGGSGGGCSSMFSAPGFQSNQPCGSGSRAVPDISLNADWYHTPQNLYFGGGLGGNGGTSIVAPELAGFFAQENSYLLAMGNVCAGSPCARSGTRTTRSMKPRIWRRAARSVLRHHVRLQQQRHRVRLLRRNRVGRRDRLGLGQHAAAGLGVQLAACCPTPAGRRSPSRCVAGGLVQHGPVDRRLDRATRDHRASGVAGFSSAWNARSAIRPARQTPGSGNSFYSGPQYPKATNGGWTWPRTARGATRCTSRPGTTWASSRSNDPTGRSVTTRSRLAITKTPAVSLQNHAGPVKSNSVPLLVQWTGSDATSGINHYKVYESKDGSSFAQVAAPRRRVGGASTSRRATAIGSRSPARTTPTTPAGRGSASRTRWRRSRRTTARLPTRPAGRAGRCRAPTAVRSSTPRVAGKTATLTFSGRGQVAWVSTMRPTHGSANVKLDSGAAKTINTHATTIAKAVIVDVVKSKSGAHHLVINVVGTSGHPQVDVDAFVILSH